jgi:hypothetical protein
MCLCELGCGNEAVHTQKNGRKICSTWMSKCPAMREKNKLGNTGRIISEEWKQKLSESNKKTKATQTIIAWNKGVTKEMHPGMKAVSEAQKKLAEEQMQKVILESHHAYVNYASYRIRVTSRSKRIYEKHKHLLNPSDLPIGKFGDGVHHIDHIYPTLEGFRRNIPIEIMAGIDNLQVLPYNENIAKSNKITIIPESINNYLLSKGLK